MGYGADRVDLELPDGRTNVGKIVLESMSDWFRQVRDGTAAP
jgi:hypothetical protein